MPKTWLPESNETYDGLRVMNGRSLTNFLWDRPQKSYQQGIFFSPSFSKTVIWKYLDSQLLSNMQTFIRKYEHSLAKDYNIMVMRFQLSVGNIKNYCEIYKIYIRESYRKYNNTFIRIMFFEGQCTPFWFNCHWGTILLATPVHFLSAIARIGNLWASTITIT